LSSEGRPSALPLWVLLREADDALALQKLRLRLGEGVVHLHEVLVLFLVEDLRQHRHDANLGGAAVDAASRSPSGQRPRGKPSRYEGDRPLGAPAEQAPDTEQCGRRGFGVSVVTPCGGPRGGRGGAHVGGHVQCPGVQTRL